MCLHALVYLFLLVSISCVSVSESGAWSDCVSFVYFVPDPSAETFVPDPSAETFVPDPSAETFVPVPSAETFVC